MAVDRSSCESVAAAGVATEPVVAGLLPHPDASPSRQHKITVHNGSDVFNAHSLQLGLLLCNIGCSRSSRKIMRSAPVETQLHYDEPMIVAITPARTSTHDEMPLIIHRRQSLRGRAGNLR